MLKKEAIKQECIKKDHKDFQIVAVDLSDELNKENDFFQHYCVKCLLEKIGNKKIILYEEAIKKSQIINQEVKKNTQQQQQQKMESIQKLQVVIKSIEGDFLKQFDDLKKLLEIQINYENQKLKKIPEPTTPNDDIKLLSSGYLEDGRLASPSPNLDYKEITKFIIQFKNLLYQLGNFEQLQEVQKEIQKIEQTYSINLQIDKQQKKKTPALNFTCEDHQMEIIMLNLNQTKFEQTNPFLCVECAHDLLTKGDKAASNTISLMKAENKWNEYIQEQMEKKSQRQSRFNQAIGYIKNLQEKYNQELNKMIQSLNEQLKKQPKEYEELMKLQNTHLKNQDKQNLLEIIKILGQTDQQKNKGYVSNQEDSEFYKDQNKVLEELIRENLVVENQITWLQNYDKQPRKLDDSDKDLEVIEFLKKSTIQDQYLSFFEISFNYLKNLEKEEYELREKGKLQKIIKSEQEIEPDLMLIQQYWYQSFQESQAKLKRLLKIDELQTSQQQYEELLMQEKENKKKITDLEALNQNLNSQLERALANIGNINQMVQQNKDENKEQINELKQIYSFFQLNWERGDTKLLQSYYAIKIYQKIEEKTSKRIKNKYLIYSSKSNGLSFSSLWGCINKMSNLLMIFKSKTQYIFGGFTPCQWLLQSGGSYQVDEELQSFLFSQTQDEIYPIISTHKSYAIQGNLSVLGFGNYDIKINQDFQDGSSQLGNTYQSNQYSITDSKNHLYGSPKPNIIECEVIMLTFEEKISYKKRSKKIQLKK